MAPRRELLERCLGALARELETTPSEALVVVDDEVQARGLESFSSGAFGVLPLVQPGGAAVRRNAAFGRVSGRVVALMDDDAEPLPGYGAALVACFADGGDRVVQGLIRPEFEIEPAPALESVLFHLGGFNALGERRRRDVFISANCAFSRGVLDTVGPMRGDMGPGSGGVPWGDDTDWHRRATEAGFVTEFDEGVAVRHRVQANRISVAAVLERAERVGRTLARLEWDGRRPPLGTLAYQRLLAVWGRLRAGSDPGARCLGRRLQGYADELARLRAGD